MQKKYTPIKLVLPHWVVPWTPPPGTDQPRPRTNKGKGVNLTAHTTQTFYHAPTTLTGGAFTVPRYSRNGDGHQDPAFTAPATLWWALRSYHRRLVTQDAWLGFHFMLVESKSARDIRAHAEGGKGITKFHISMNLDLRRISSRQYVRRDQRSEADKEKKRGVAPNTYLQEMDAQFIGWRDVFLDAISIRGVPPFTDGPRDGALTSLKVW